MCVHHVRLVVVSPQYFNFAKCAKVTLVVQPVNPHVVLRLELFPAQVAFQWLAIRVSELDVFLEKRVLFEQALYFHASYFIKSI